MFSILKNTFSGLYFKMEIFKKSPKNYLNIVYRYINIHLYKFKIVSQKKTKKKAREKYI